MFEFCGKKIPNQFIHDISRALTELKENQEINKLLSLKNSPHSSVEWNK